MLCVQYVLVALVVGFIILYLTHISTSILVVVVGGDSDAFGDGCSGSGDCIQKKYGRESNLLLAIAWAQTTYKYCTLWMLCMIHMRNTDRLTRHLVFCVTYEMP